MNRTIVRRVEALESDARPTRWRFPTMADFYAGRMANGTVCPNGDVICVPPGPQTWEEFFARLPGQRTSEPT